MKLRFLRKHEYGATLVEVLVAIALTGIMLPALITALVAANAGRPTDSQNIQASSLLREATEAVRSVREKGWSNVATDGTYHPTISGSAWALTSGSESISGFTRQIVISTPQRNSSGVLVGSGGTNDPSTKHVVITVSWTTPVAASVSTDEYLTRWQGNTAWNQTTQADFSAGTLTNTCATVTCASNLVANTLTLADSPATWQLPSVIGTGYNITGNVAGNDVFVATISSVKYAFVGYATGLAIVNISSPAAPTLAGSLTTPAAVNGVFVSGTTAYLATANANGQLTTVNVANPAAPALLKAFQIQDTNNVAATAVYVSGTTAYVVKKKVGKAILFNTYGEINAVNVSNPSNPTLSSALNVGDDCNGIWLSGTKAYVATGVTNQELTVVNVATPTNITSSATVDLNADATDIVIQGTTAYISTQNNAGSGELRIYNITPTTPTALGSYEVGAAVDGVSIDSTNPNYLVLATGVAAKQAIIINVATPATPTLVNNVTLGGVANKVVIDGSYAYFGTADTAKEMTVVYAGYRPSGTYESPTFDATANAAYNYLNFTDSVPASTTLQLQVAANNTNAGWSYVGPDGTSGTFYTAPGAIPLSITSNRYFRYKAFLTTTNGQATPVLNDTEVNYSP